MNATSWFTVGVLTGAALTAAPLLYVVAGSTAPATKVVENAAPRAVGSDATPGKALSMEEATTRLEARLERNGGSTDDWELLAKSYDFLGRAADAARARRHLAAGAAAKQQDSGMASPAATNADMPSAAEVAQSRGLLMPNGPAAGTTP